MFYCRINNRLFQERNYSDFLRLLPRGQAHLRQVGAHRTLILKILLFDSWQIGPTGPFAKGWLRARRNVYLHLRAPKSTLIVSNALCERPFVERESAVRTSSSVLFGFFAQELN